MQTITAQEMLQARAEASELAADLRSTMADRDRLLAERDRLRALLRTCKCPRPANAAPDHITVDDCIKRRECGCDLGDAVGAGEETYRKDELRRLDGKP